MIGTGFASNVGTMWVSIRLDNGKLIGGLRAAYGRLSWFARSISTVFGGVTNLFLGLGRTILNAIMMPLRVIQPHLAAFGIAVTTLGTALISSKRFAEFEHSMNRVRVLAGSTRKEYVELTEQALELGRTTVFSARQAADAMQKFALAGFSSKEIAESLPATLNLAAAGMVDISDATQIAAQTMRNMGMEADEMGRVADSLTIGFTKSTQDLTDLGHAFVYAGGTAAAAGIPIEEVTAHLMALADAGFRGSLGGTALRNMVARLSGASRESKKFLDELGVSTEAVDGTMRPLADIVDDINDKMKGMGHLQKTSKVFHAFGHRAGPALAKMLAFGGDALREYEDKVNHAGGIAAKVARETLVSVKGQFILMASAWSTSAIEFGKTMSDIVRAIINAARELAPVFFQAAGAVQPLTDAIGFGIVRAIKGFKSLLADITPDLTVWSNLVVEIADNLIHFGRIVAEHFLGPLGGTTGLFGSIKSWITSILDIMANLTADIPKTVEYISVVMKGSWDDLALYFANKAAKLLGDALLSAFVFAFTAAGRLIYPFAQTVLEAFQLALNPATSSDESQEIAKRKEKIASVERELASARAEYANEVTTHNSDLLAKKNAMEAAMEFEARGAKEDWTYRDRLSAHIETNRRTAEFQEALKGSPRSQELRGKMKELETELDALTTGTGFSSGLKDMERRQGIRTGDIFKKQVGDLKGAFSSDAEGIFTAPEGTADRHHQKRAEELRNEIKKTRETRQREREKAIQDEKDYAAKAADPEGFAREQRRKHLKAQIEYAEKENESLRRVQGSMWQRDDDLYAEVQRRRAEIGAEAFEAGLTPYDEELKNRFEKDEHFIEDKLKRNEDMIGEAASEIDAIDRYALEGDETRKRRNLAAKAVQRGGEAAKRVPLKFEFIGIADMANKIQTALSETLTDEKDDVGDLQLDELEDHTGILKDIRRNTMPKPPGPAKFGK